jgi:HEAT repeat protein
MWEIIAGISIAVLSTGGLISAVGWALSSADRKLLRRWQNVVQSCGLQVEKTSKPSEGPWLEARDGPLTVKLQRPGPSRDYGCLVLLSIPGPPGFSAVHIRREQSKSRGAHEFEIGDKPFDRAFYILGPPRLLAALLDMETRHLLISVNAETENLEIGNRQLRVITTTFRLRDLLPLLLDIARRFAQPLDLAKRLAENVRRDPDAEVRMRNLLLLAREFAGAPETLEALRAACADGSPWIRLRAAKELGDEGNKVLLEMAETTKDDAISAEAVSLLGRSLPIERARALLLHSLGQRRHLTARSCLETLGSHGAAEDVDTLVKVMTREHNELAIAAATALGTTENPAAESPLIQALQREQTDLQVAAANALARIGTAAAVLPLKDLAEHTFHHPELRKATRQAIAEIQSRLPGASPGQLSLAGAEAGQLSLAQAEAGQLSLATDPAGELSLSGDEEG